MSGAATGDHLAEQTVGTFLARLADRVPAPGGGAVAALHAAQAAALLAMVGRYSTGERFQEHRALVEGIVESADALRAECLGLADADAAAFTAVGAAYRLPRSTTEEEQHRRREIAIALEGAAAPPAAVIRAATALIDLAERLLPVANRSVVTDVAAATEALRAAATTARLNIEVNLAGIHDESARSGLEAALGAVDHIMRRSVAVEQEVRDQIRR